MFKKNKPRDERYYKLSKKYEKGKITIDEYIERIYEMICMSAYDFFGETEDMKKSLKQYLDTKKHMRSDNYSGVYEKLDSGYLEIIKTALPQDVECRNVTTLPISAELLSQLYELLKKKNIEVSGMDRLRYIAEQVYSKKDCEHVLNSPYLYSNIMNGREPVTLKEIGYHGYYTLAFVMIAESVRAELMDDKPNTNRNKNGFFTAFEDDLIELMQAETMRLPKSDKTVTIKVPQNNA